MTYINGDTRIRQICHKILAEDSLLPKQDTTYCNFAVFRILEYFGLQWNFWNEKEKRIMLANEMCEMMASKYIEVPINEVNKTPNFLMLSGWKNDNGHGHVAVIYPTKVNATSRKWLNIEVPMVANVGKYNGIIGLNYAFAEKPKIYLIAEIPAMQWDERNDFI